MKLGITIYRDEDGWYVVDCPAILGCASQGESEDEAVENIREAIHACLQVRRDQGLPLTIATREIEVPLLA